MGKVIVQLRLVNNGEWFNYDRNLSRRQPHQVEIEALVDTGATRLYLKKCSEPKAMCSSSTRTRATNRCLSMSDAAEALPSSGSSRWNSPGPKDSRRRNWPAPRNWLSCTATRYRINGMKSSIVELGLQATRVWVEGGAVCLLLADDREIRFPAAKNRRLRQATPPANCPCGIDLRRHGPALA